MSFIEALQDWWDSRDIRKIRKRRRIKSQKFLKDLDKKKDDVENDVETRLIASEREEKVIPIKKKTQLSMKGAFFAGKFVKNTKFKVLTLLSAFLIVTFLLIVLFSSDIFAVSNFEYDYTESIFIKEELIDEAISKFKGDNIIMLSTKEIKDIVIDTFPTISFIDIKKVYPKTLMFKIKEFKPALILRKGQSEGDEFLINQAGYVMSRRPYTGPNTDYVTVLSTDQELEASVGDKLMDHYIVDFIYRAQNVFEDKVGIPVISIWWLDRERELHMWTQKYFKVLMTFDRPVEDQIQDMITALQDSRIKRRDFEYVDLRIPNKVFVKPR